MQEGLPCTNFVQEYNKTENLKCFSFVNNILNKSKQ